MPTDQEILLDFGNKLAQEIKVRSKDTDATGASSEGVQVKATEKQLQVIDSKGYYEFREFGRGPGKQPPILNIISWVKIRHSLTIASQIEKRARGIAINIGKFGTKAYQKFKATGQGTGILSEVINEEAMKSLTSQIFKGKIDEIRTEIQRLWVSQ